jgi:hypothetical protein
MGEARNRRLAGPKVIYHHTSTLWTNQIWMSGVIDVEGKARRAVHPEFGETGPAPGLRRSFKDFPPLAWFTTRIGVPNCLVNFRLLFVDTETGEVEEEPGDQLSHALALNRVALGFPLVGQMFVKWSDHPGYATAEGRELNDLARDLGDDPGDWYVSERPVDVLTAGEFWLSRSTFEPKLERFDVYLAEIHKMVTLCRTRKGAFIAPTWLTPSEGEQLARRWGSKVAKPLPLQVH